MDVSGYILASVAVPFEVCIEMGKCVLRIGVDGGLVIGPGVGVGLAVGPKIDVNRQVWHGGGGVNVEPSDDGGLIVTPPGDGGGFVFEPCDGVSLGEDSTDDGGGV